MRTIEAPPTGGLRGSGDLKIVNETQVGVTIQDGEGKTHYKTLEYPQGVSMVSIRNWKMQEVQDVFVQLEPDEGDIRFIRPRNGTFYVEFARFGAEPGEPPTLRLDKPKDYQGDPWLPARLKAFGLYEIFGAGVYSGMEVLDMLTYQFQWDENLQDWDIVESTRKKWREHFDTVLNVFGFDRQHDTFAYEGENYMPQNADVAVANVLAELGDILSQRKKIAQVTLKDGWVQQDLIIPGPFGMTREMLEAATASA